MPSDFPSELKAEIGHVLFIDIVGYSKLLINEQTELLEHLKGMVRGSEQVRVAEAEGKLIRLATGDGMALVFRNSPEAPAQCALELSRADKKHPELQLRMGIHSGPINEVTDVNERTNVTGAGINLAQRVMDCGDAGHILLSQRAADDLAQYRHWQPLLHDLGECEVKHSVRLRLVNLYTDDLGNPAIPEKLKAVAAAQARPRSKVGILILVLALITLLTLGVIFGPAIFRADRSAPPPPASASPVVAIPAKSIAVLPFDNLSGDKDEQYFSDGLSEDLITALSQFTGLKVIGRNSAFQFRDSKDDSKTIGTKLGVAHLLEGSVRRAGGVVRISAELINAADGSTRWSQRYDRPYKDLFAVQDDITEAVATALRTKLLPGEGVVQNDRPPSGNLDAYNAYLQGKFHLARDTEADYQEAASYFSEAVRLDPRYAQAYAALSETEGTFAGNFLSGAQAKRAYVRARTAANTAALDPNNAAAHRALGMLYNFVDLDWVNAEREFRRALQLSPNDDAIKIDYGLILATLGRLDQAIDVTREALATDSLNAAGYYRLADYLLSLGRLDEAEQASRKALELQPTSGFAHQIMCDVQIQRGDIAAALKVASTTPAGPFQDMLMMIVQQAGSDRATADAALQGFIDKYADLGAFQIAQTYAFRKEPDKAFEWLDRAWVNRDPGIAFLLYDPFLLRYKDDPRFAAFCKKVGLPTPEEVAAAPKP